jgi:hypothetical protein
MNHPVPEGGYHSNPSDGGNIGQCFHGARLVGRELMSAEIALPETRDLPLSHWTRFEFSCMCKKYIVYFLADGGDLI